MDCYVNGIKPANEKFKQMKAIWDMCDKADIKVPEEVGDFFGWEEPSQYGVVVSQNELGDAIEELKEEYTDGYLVYLDRLPKDVKVLKFYNSY